MTQETKYFIRLWISIAMLMVVCFLVGYEARTTQDKPYNNIQESLPDWKSLLDGMIEWKRDCRIMHLQVPDYYLNQGSNDEYYPIGAFNSYPAIDQLQLIDHIDGKLEGVSYQCTDGTYLDDNNMFQ